MRDNTGMANMVGILHITPQADSSLYCYVQHVDARLDHHYRVASWTAFMQSSGTAYLSDFETYVHARDAQGDLEHLDWLSAQHARAASRALTHRMDSLAADIVTYRQWVDAYVRDGIELDWTAAPIVRTFYDK